MPSVGTVSPQTTRELEQLRAEITHLQESVRDVSHYNHSSGTAGTSRNSDSAEVQTTML